MQAVSTTYAAEALFEAGRFSDAVVLLERAPFQDLPVDHRNILTSSLIRLNRYSDVVELLEDVSSDELSPELRNCLIEALFKTGQYERTTDLIERYPFDQSLEARKMLAQSLFALGRYYELVPLIALDVAHEFPGGLPADLQLLYARALFKIRHYQEVLDTLKSAPVEKSLDFGAVVAASLFELGRFLEAATLIEKMIRNNPPLENDSGSKSPDRPEIKAGKWTLLERGRLEAVPDELRTILIWSLFKLGRYTGILTLLTQIPWDLMAASTRKMFLASLSGLLGDDDFASFAHSVPPEEVNSNSRNMLIEGFGRINMHSNVAALLEKLPAAELAPATAPIVAESLYSLRRFAEAAALFDDIPLEDISDELRGIYAETLFALERFDDIPRVAGAAKSMRAKLHLAYAKLLADDEKGAVPLFEEALEAEPSLRRPHHNYSSRDPSNYQPIELDFAAGADGILYDQYNTLGERVIYVGAGHLSTKMYSGALKAQKRLRQHLPPPSAPLNDLLQSLGVDFAKLKILPPAWTTQIGHLGLTDVLFRMRELGWWKGQAVILAREGAIGNVPMLSLFEASAPVLIAGVNVSAEVWNELFSLQRYLGLPFNSWEMPDGTYVNWSDAGAILMQQWDAERRADPLRQLYDQRYGADPAVKTTWEHMRSDWGMQPNDWHVCLHLRDASFHQDHTHDHRNADFANYIDAIRYITDQGGWVVRVGASSAFQLPEMPRLVDYTAHPLRSSVMDLHVIRTAHYFIGTMSGLTNVAVSFGIPAALVNCTTYESQVWNSRVRFALKTSVTADGKKLNQRELTSTPWRWRVFDLEVLKRYDLRLLDNSSDEILETVKEVAALADGLDTPEDDLLAAWRKCLHLPYFYGNARPSRYFLQKRGPDFLA